MKQIFEPVSLGGIQMRNRLVRSATYEKGAAEQGAVSDMLIQAHTELARGGVGLIITGMMGVGENARFNESMVDVQHQSFARRGRELTDAVHGAGGKIVIQLSHCGAKAAPLAREALAPSVIQGEKALGPARAMTKAEIAGVAADFARAARRCQEAGADGVQLHGAHGYLLSEFLCPRFNRREDEYGGSIENRARLTLEVYDAVRAAVGPDYPVLIKINYSDLLEDGLIGEDCVWVCQELDRRGIDAIEVSSGFSISRDSSSSPKPEGEGGLFTAGAQAVVEAVEAPVISVGGYRSPAAVQRALDGGIQAVAMSRPLIRQPDLPTLWQQGATGVECVSCRGCFKVPSYGCLLLQQAQ